MKVSAAVLSLACAGAAALRPATAAATTTAETAASGAADAFAALGTDDVAALLADWNLAGVFGAEFAAAGVDGDALIHATPAELTEAFADVPRLQWNRLFRKLVPLWTAARANHQQSQAAPKTPLEEQVVGAGGEAAAPHRNLAEGEENVISGMALGGYSGVRIMKANAVVQLGDNVALARTADGLVVAADEVNITGDLRVVGSLLGDDIDEIYAALAELQDNLTALQTDVYCEDCSNTTVTPEHLIVTKFNNASGLTQVAVDPAATGGCPGELVLATDKDFNYGRGLNTCYRNQTTAGFKAFYYEVEHQVGSIDIDLVYHQHYSADGFASGADSDVEDDYFCEGVSFAAIDALGNRRHIYTAAVGYSRSANFSSYNCGPRNCEYSDDEYCTGPSAPLWMGDAYSCNSGATGAPTAAWYNGMEAEFSAGIRMEEGELLEVRVMADQESANEDVGISKLTITLSSDPGFPYDDGSGWVEFEEPTDNTTVVGIAPGVAGNCPGDMDLVRGYEGAPTCTRSLAGAGAVSASYEVAHAVGSVTIEALSYNQWYSADGFAGASAKDIDDDDFMEGISIAHVDSGDVRHHVFSAAVGLTYDAAQTSYNCPAAAGCAYSDQDYCVGPKAPAWMGTNVFCDSGNSGAWEAKWYTNMGPSDPVELGATMEDGDAVEVRMMADQATSNEDVGLTLLKMTLNAEQAYPYALSNGWVVFEEPEDGKMVVGIDPRVSGQCPGTMVLVYGYNDVPTCSRASDAAGSVAAKIEAPFDIGTATVDITYNQYYSADAFSSASGTDIDDSYFMEGVTISSVNSASVRSHVFSAAVGLAYDTAYTDYNCPTLQCGYTDSSNCVGPKAPPWMGLAYYCDSANAGAWEETWYADMGPVDPVELGVSIADGDDIEVRIMADQATSNEDAGITSLRLTLETAQTYPYDLGNGWVMFEEPTNTTFSVGIDPRVGGRCPGGFSIVSGYQGSPVCTRVQTGAGAVSASVDVPFDAGTFEVDIEYNQYYSADAFAGDSGASVESTYYMEGIGIAAIDSTDVRTHLFSAAVGLCYDVAYADYNCPEYKCGYLDTAYCNGPLAHPWQGGNFYCNSKNSGDWEEVWYAPMGPEETVVTGVSIAKGDLLEVRAMADQASSNEDAGITSLKMTLKAKQTYPVDLGTGWVLFEEPTDTSTVIGIDPAVGGTCPGSIQIDNGYKGAPICTRNLDAAGNRNATFDLVHDADSVTIDLSYAQHYSADGFASKESKTINSPFWMEGVAIAKKAADGSRTHIFAAAVGIAHDTANTGYNCPSKNCGYDSSTYCVGPAAPTWVGDDYWCDSGNAGAWEQIWYEPMQTPQWTVNISLSEGDTIEVRIMADQATSNEDAGIVQLKLAFEQADDSRRRQRS